MGNEENERMIKGSKGKEENGRKGKGKEEKGREPYEEKGGGEDMES